MEPWTPHALKYRRTDTGTGKSNGESGESSETGTGKGTSGDSFESGQGKGNIKTCVNCGVYQVFSGRTDESCPRKRGQPCQFVTVLTQKGDDGAAEDEKQKGKGNSDFFTQAERYVRQQQERKGQQQDRQQLLRDFSMHVYKGKSQSTSEGTGTGKGTSGDSSETGTGKGTSGDSFETGQGKGNSKSGDSFEETGTGKGKSGDSLTGKGKSGDSLTGKGKSKSGDSFDPDDSSPRSQASTYPLPSEWASAFEEAYAQEQDESPARPLRRWASGVLRSPPSYTVPDGLDDPTPEDPREVPEDPLEVTGPNNQHEVPGPQENPPAEDNPYED